MKYKYQEEEAKHLFFTSDTHFYHKNIIEYAQRPFSSIENMNKELIKNWNSVVSSEDTVFHLGDIGFCGSEKLRGILSQLNGHIILVKGNHDSALKESFCNEMFEFHTNQLHLNIEGYSVYLNHYPFLCFSGDLQLFGHIHSNSANPTNDIDRFMLYGLPNQYDVGVDNNNYAPVSWLEIKNKLLNEGK